MDSIEIKSGSKVGRPSAEEKFVFFDSDNSNQLTSKDSNGNVTVYYNTPVSIVSIPAIVNTNIVIGNNQIGINITGGYEIGTGSITITGTGQIAIL